ncbi:MAG: sigma-70 family RNA polymerase sigma factor [Sedimentisphaerales bacterium]|nr:sigma-70 family RNA polymerase sigma factor [Sedimentisphaerales bacterium]
MSTIVSEPEGLTLAKRSEEQLVRAVIAGDRTAYETLYDRFAPIVRAVCHDYTRNLADAQDLAQDVFLCAYQRLGKIHKPASFGPWIIDIARRRCVEWRRQQVRRRRRHEKLQTEPAIAENMATGEEVLSHQAEGAGSGDDGPAGDGPTRMGASFPVRGLQAAGTEDHRWRESRGHRDQRAGRHSRVIGTIEH